MAVPGWAGSIPIAVRPLIVQVPAKLRPTPTVASTWSVEIPTNPLTVIKG